MATPHPLMALIKAERQRQGLSAAELARRTGYTPDAHRKWESGKNVPDLDRLEDCLTALGLRIAIVPIAERPAATDPQVATA